MCSLCAECCRGAITSEWNWPLVNWPVLYDGYIFNDVFVSTAFRIWKFWRFSRIFMFCCMNPEISPHNYLIKINGLLWLSQSTIKINLFSFDCFFVQWTNGHVYADVIPICRSINVLWIKTISISKVTKYCAALSNAKLNRKWRPLKCIFHNRIRMRF